jgi:hypothetical protein
MKKIYQILKPIDNGHELVRIGAPKDGGYLLPNDLVGIDICFSPGVAKNWSFEKDLYDKFKIPSVMYDGAVDAPRDLTEEHLFHKKYIGMFSSHNFISVSDVIKIDLQRYSGDLLAQIDIEGGEYAIFSTISKDELCRFRVIIVEMHEIDRWIQKRYFNEIVSPILDKLFTTHDLVHSHPFINTLKNSGGYFRFKGYKIPKVVELTFHRKDRAKYYGENRIIPNTLDADNF